VNFSLSAVNSRLRGLPGASLPGRAYRSVPPGLAQVVELADQLRGRRGARQVPGARGGLAENAGGYIGPEAAVASITVLTA
jgi:hypothetical protein